MLSLNVCHLHFKVSFQVIIENPEWQCSMLCKIGKGSQAVKEYLQNCMWCTLTCFEFFTPFPQNTPSWVSLSFATNFSIFSHVPYYSNRSKSRELLSKFCTFLSSNVWACFLFCGGFFCLFGCCLLSLFLFLFVVGLFFWFWGSFSKEALANAKTVELFFLNSSHYCKTQWRVISVKAFLIFWDRQIAANLKAVMFETTTFTDMTSSLL